MPKIKLTPDDRWVTRLTVPQAAEILGVNQDTVRRMLNRGTLPGWKLGRDWIVDLAAFARLLDDKDVSAEIEAIVRARRPANEGA